MNAARRRPATPAARRQLAAAIRAQELRRSGSTPAALPEMRAVGAGRAERSTLSDPLFVVPGLYLG